MTGQSAEVKTYWRGEILIDKKGEKVMFDKLVEVICNFVEVEPENVHMESRFIEDLGFTSFDFMSMLGELEDEFDVEIELKDTADIRTVGDAAAFLEKLSEEA